jgi:hypothetical protein
MKSGPRNGAVRVCWIRCLGELAEIGVMRRGRLQRLLHEGFVSDGQGLLGERMVVQSYRQSMLM